MPISKDLARCLAEHDTPIEPLRIMLHPVHVGMLDEFPGEFAGKEVHVVTWVDGKPTSQMIQTAEGERLC